MSRLKGYKRKLLAERLAEYFDLPVTMFSWGMNFELQNDRDLFVEGCTSISEYTDTCVIFSGKDMKLIVTGNEFELYSFADGRIRLSGKVNSVTIERGE